MTGKKTAFQQLCKENHWRCTPQRLAVYEFMQGNLCHPSVDSIWERVREKIPSITRESVYRILNEFVSSGLLGRLDRIENARYDSRTIPHGHLICEKCGLITDFLLKKAPEMPEDLDVETVHHVELRISWICPECRKKGSSQGKSQLTRSSGRLKRSQKRLKK